MYDVLYNKAVYIWNDSSINEIYFVFSVQSLTNKLQNVIRLWLKQIWGAEDEWSEVHTSDEAPSLNGLQDCNPTLIMVKQTYALRFPGSYINCSYNKNSLLILWLYISQLLVHVDIMT